jgi:hypothetical protein
MLIYATSPLSKEMLKFEWNSPNGLNMIREKFYRPIFEVFSISLQPYKVDYVKWYCFVDFAKSLVQDQVSFETHKIRFHS